MEIDDIRVYVRNENKLKAFVTVTMDKVLVVHNMKIVQGQRGLILCMPSRKGPDGKFRDIVHPITNDFRAELEKRIFTVYEEEIKKLSATVAQAPEPALSPELEPQEIKV